ncbi:MAG: VanZ family protein [Candidatus Omnitrophica bacterium]|nr:VanZ family protein [Candidatus Omnitrophota bacterium]
MLIPVLYMMFIFILSSIPGEAYEPIFINTVISNMLHIPLFGVLAFLWMRTFANKKVRLNKAFIYTMIITIVYAAFNEFHQSFVPGREMSLGDFAMDTLGCIAAIYLYRRKVK